MREIKFRAWNTASRKMLPDSDWAYEWSTIREQHEKGLIVILQYTGLKDKNGAEIYEGDILSKEGRSYPVRYMWNEFCIDGYDNGDYYHGEDNAYHDWESFEVVGNIYENPELIKGEAA